MCMQKIRAYPLRGRAIRHSLRSAIAPLRSNNTSYPLRNQTQNYFLSPQLNLGSLTIFAKREIRESILILGNS